MINLVRTLTAAWFPSCSTQPTPKRRQPERGACQSILSVTDFDLLREAILKKRKWENCLLRLDTVELNSHYDYIHRKAEGVKVVVCFRFTKDGYIANVACEKLFSFFHDSPTINISSKFIPAYQSLLQCFSEDARRYGNLITHLIKIQCNGQSLVSYEMQHDLVEWSKRNTLNPLWGDLLRSLIYHVAFEDTSKC